jgi:hypothetical protein
MILIDGQETSLDVSHFCNLEELLVKVMEGGTLDDRIVTDVRVNGENFTELYPHQAEDIDASELRRVEIDTVPVHEMAASMADELGKVVDLMSAGGRQVADLFRQADDGAALEMYQDLLDVTRDFLAMVWTLRDSFGLQEDSGFGRATEEISSLFSEMLEVLEREDWILLSDLMEYEFLPVVERWKGVAADLRQELGATRQ